MRRLARHLLSTAAALGACHGALAAPRGFNDTGSTQCLAASGALSPDCAGTGQDGAYGRDVTKDDDSDGHAGFRLQKIAADGSVLPRTAAAWACVEDQVTELIWEIKTDDGTIRDKDTTFTNQPNAHKKRGDASNYVAKMNEQALCGATDWRLPTLLELQGLVDFSVQGNQSAIDNDWFPNTSAFFTWTSTPATPFGPSQHWVVDFDGDLGGDHFDPDGAPRVVRVVRGAKVALNPDRYTANSDGSADDQATRLVWRRCSEGQTWTGATCKGAVTPMTFLQAMAHANAEALRTGVAWRVPSAKEMETLADRAQADPAINPTVFPNTPGGPDQWDYWTSTPFVPDPTRAWSFRTYAGYTNSVPQVSTLLSVRLVHDMP